MQKEIPHCAEVHVHTDTVHAVQRILPAEDLLYELAELYKIFGDSTRIRILYALFASPLCVCDIAALLSMTVSAISHQLRILRAAKLVTAKKNGRTVIYRLSDDHVRMILEMGIEHIREVYVPSI